jgi:hypothetical protein
VVHRMNLVLPPETPVDVLQIPGLRHILNSLLAAQNGLDFGEYEEVPPEEPRVAIPAAEEPSRCPPRGPLAAGMAVRSERHGATLRRGPSRDGGPFEHAPDAGHAGHARWAP